MAVFCLHCEWWYFWCVKFRYNWQFSRNTIRSHFKIILFCQFRLLTSSINSVMESELIIRSNSYFSINRSRWWWQTESFMDLISVLVGVLQHFVDRFLITFWWLWMLLTFNIKWYTSFKHWFQLNWLSWCRLSSFKTSWIDYLSIHCTLLMFQLFIVRRE